LKDLTDLTAPAQIERKPTLEAEVQAKCVAWMRSRGYWCRKFSSISQRSVPDYLFSRGTYRTKDHFCRYASAAPGACSCCCNIPALKFFTEFKREGCKVDKETGFMSTEAQVEEQEAMRAAGWYGFECSDIEVFKKTVLEYERSLLC
jgi:hypothetical protein